MYKLQQQRDYNHLYTCGRLALQIMQQGQHNGVIVDLLPSVALAVLNEKLIVGLSFKWVCGDINIGIMRREFQEQERVRREQVKEMAAKIGVTPRQYALQWGW